MKKFFLEKISVKLVTLILVIVLAVPGAYFIWPPKPAQADFSACLTIFTTTLATVFGEGVTKVPVQPTSQGTSVGESMSNLIEDCVEQGIATAIGKIILTTMTNEIVNWINSGFQGSPAFVTNPGAFFENVGDQVAGSIIAGSGLSALCSPFSLQEKLALSLNFSLSISAGGADGASSISQENSCTLSSIIGNATNAVNNFVDDFSQGGWPAYFGISMSAQNNPYGSFLQADANIQASIDSQQGVESQKLDWGTGFMSTETCTDEEGDTVSQNDLDDYGNDDVTCTVSTPGHTIAGVLDKQLGIPADQLGVADDLDKIFNALGYELVTLALEKGLGGGTQVYANGMTTSLTGTNYSGYLGLASSTETGLINSIPTPTTTPAGGPGGTNVTTPPDSTKPSISLSVPSPMIVGVGSTFTNPVDTVVPTTGNTVTSQTTTGTVNTAVAGRYTLTYNATDSSGASNTLTLQVIVDSPPVIILNGNNPMDLGFNASYHEPGATAIDDLDGNISSKIVITGAPTVNDTSGTFDVVYSVTDSLGLSATPVTRVVTFD